ncbi:endoplasmic reticulum aminopeptidase 1-like [Penaeus indicus]|uniref:endoplasmic reticulum aminopeptidase 1-like n=1 Tax=Penaeus indicus TaxID=29960 RepID=UPI00300DB030
MEGPVRMSDMLSNSQPHNNYNTLNNEENSGSPNESGFMVNKRAMYEPGAVMVCSQKRACCVVTLGFVAIIAVALIVAFTKPGCPEATYTGEPLPGQSIRPTSSPPTTPPTATNGELFPWTSVRLPTHVRPLHYDLSLHPNLTSRYVKGELTIKLTAIEETQQIVIHGHELNVTSYKLHNKYEKPIGINKFLEYPAHQQLYLKLDEILRRGSNYTLRLSYEFTLKEGLEGFYLSSYKTASGEKRYIATTHFEPTAARAAFPCFDEPQLKAKFHLGIYREPHQFTLFNMPLQTSVKAEDSELIHDQFQESVEMSTYLVAFVVCDYDHVTNKTSNNVSVSVYAPPMMISQASYALRMATQILDFYETFFGVPYPLPKQDLIAIPDFGAGAMENWGLITYRETALMFDPNHTSSRAQQRVTVVIAHELAHQWFGNLVTMAWWSDLWLNEGFASFMENLGTGVAEPGWAMQEQFIVEKMQPALSLDALLASHPISTPVADPAQIESIFDTISYKKGASIIGMLESFIGQDMLKAGLRLYLEAHRYGNAATDDLWEALTRVLKKSGHNHNHICCIGASIIGMLESFIGQDMLKAGLRLYLEAHRYGNAATDDLWEALTRVLKKSVEFEVGKEVKWIKFNVGQRGFYRVTYDEGGWDALIHVLQTEPHTLSPADRASLLDDAFTLVKAGTINATVALNLSLYLKRESLYIPWHTALNHLFSWVQLLFNYPAHTLMLEYIHILILPHYERVGWMDTGTHIERLLRSEILMAAVECGNIHAIEEAQKRFAAWRNKNESIPPNLRSVVYKTGVRYGTEEDWRHCWQVYNTSSIPSEKSLMLKAMAQTRDPWLMQQYLEYTLDGSKIRPQDVMIVLREVSQNPGGRLSAWRMVRQHWTQISQLFGHGSFTIGAIIKAVTSPFTSAFDLGEVESFFSNVDVGPGERALAQALETIRLHIQWHEHNLDDVTQWLHQQLSKPEGRDE